MKSYAMDMLSGGTSIGEPLRLALLDVVWLTPWWAPYLALGAGALWLVCVGLLRHRRRGAA